MNYHKGLRRPPKIDTGNAYEQGDRLSFETVGAALEVHRQLGPGLLESTYEACLCRELMLPEIPYERQVPLPVHYHGIPLDCGYRLDIVVGKLVVLEVKSVAKVLPVHRAQVMTYLKLSRLRLGLIINFNVSALRLGIYRLVLDESSVTP